MTDRLGLMKIPVSALSAAAAVLGRAACAPRHPAAALYAGACVFLLTAGAGTLNNYQDRHFDGGLERTRRRPLPSRRLRPWQALAQAGLLLSSGLAGLFLYSSSPRAPLAGVMAVLLYNALYTPLKKKTLLALIPGILCGTLPPLIGWSAAGGELFSPRIGYLMLLFGVWQLPHLWLLILANSRDELRRETASLLDSLPAPRMQRLVIIWAAAFAFLTLYLKVLRFIASGAFAVPLVLNAFVLPLIFFAALNKPWSPARARYLSRYLNVSMLAVTLMAAADTLLH